MKYPKYLLVLCGLLLAVLSIFVIAKTRNTILERDYIGKAVQDRDTITISGEGKVTATPDLANASLGVYSDGPTVAAVQSSNSKKMNAIIDGLKQSGIKDEDIQTSNYNLQPKLDWENNSQRILGYTLSQTISVKVRDLTKVGDVLQLATTMGANELYGVQFTIDDPTALQDEARIKAITQAQKKAEALANATGLHLIKVVSFSESSNGAYPPVPYALDRAVMNEQKAAAPTIASGSLDVTTDVSVTFEVR